MYLRVIIVDDNFKPEVLSRIGHLQDVAGQQLVSPIQNHTNANPSNVLSCCHPWRITTTLHVRHQAVETLQQEPHTRTLSPTKTSEKERTFKDILTIKKRNLKCHVLVLLQDYLVLQSHRSCCTRRVNESGTGKGAARQRGGVM